MGACLAVLLGAAPAASAAATDTNLASKVSSPKSPGARPGTPDARTQTQEVPKSVFVVPKSRAEGVDPFFPLSKRLDVVEVNNSTNRAAAAGELLVKGFSGTRATPLVIINDRTFGVGDEKEVVTPQGRARVRCLEIHLRTESVIVEANNERRELRFRTGK